MNEPETASSLPEGDYAIAEILGHRTIVGRIAEVERFGTKFLAIEPLFADQLYPPIFVGGSSIYQLTPCSAEVARKEQPRERYQLPSSIAVTIPKPALPAPGLDDDEDAKFTPAFLTGDDDD
ncbi:hypothetical protein [Sphingomonas koreensis]|uniref:hypothetical protein n=1 Tax=Sphingomonas koreensis TaxID=93064 RepID=UPI000F7DECD3|nr:hypothetical protein [Sphingomonas koreensis]MDC7808820.1 hypothetical protein [Sphingomonas koreensis]RSU98959.1 hypothetical protein CA256_03245 [Sphingomonas koreensis]